MLVGDLIRWRWSQGDGGEDHAEPLKTAASLSRNYGRHCGDLMLQSGYSLTAEGSARTWCEVPEIWIDGCSFREQHWRRNSK